MIFNKLGIDTEEVLQAAGTKWNFLPFRPGLVGGHCIGVDPHYLTHKAQSVGYHPEVILSGRKVNEGIGKYIASQFVKAMLKKRIHVEGSRVLVMGLTFKENCPDLRNTKVVDIIVELQEYGAQVECYDPWVNGAVAEDEYGIIPVVELKAGRYDGIIFAVAHREFKEMGLKHIRSLAKPLHVLYDLKYILPADFSDLRL